MLQSLTSTWWVFLLRGLTAIALAALLWFQPAASLAALVLLFGLWMLADGVFACLVAVVRRKDNADWGWMLLSGLMSLVLGVLTLRVPGMTVMVIALYLAAWAMMLGVSQIALGWRIRKEIKDEWALYLGGAVALLFGLSMLWNPAVGTLMVLRMTAFFSLFFGISLVLLSVRLKRSGHHVPQPG